MMRGVSVGKDSPWGIEDDTGRQVARVHMARVRRFREQVDLVEAEDGTSERLRGSHWPRA